MSEWGVNASRNSQRGIRVLDILGYMDQIAMDME